VTLPLLLVATMRRSLAGSDLTRLSVAPLSLLMSTA